MNICQHLVTIVWATFGDHALIETRAVLSPGNRAKPCKYRYVKPVRNFIGKIQRSKEKTRIFDDRTRIWHHLSDLTNEPRRISAQDFYLQKPQTVGFIFAAGSIYASPSILKQSCLKSRATMLNDSTRKTVFNAKWLFKVIQGHLFRCRWRAIGGLHTQT